MIDMSTHNREPNDMANRVCMVTGASSGIGLETAAALAGMGADVVLVVRDPTRGQLAIDEILRRHPMARVESIVADLSVVSQMRHVAREYRARHERLHVLVNNAGVMMGKRTETPDGLETNFAINYLAPFLLTHDLLPALVAGAPSRVIVVSSMMHRMGRLHLDDLQSRRDYNYLRAYSTTKLMSLMFTYELARRLEGTGVTANALHPGFVATGIGRSSGLLFRSIMRIARPFEKSPADGARTSIYLASSAEVEGVTGRYFIDCRPRRSSAISYDQQLQRTLWMETERLLADLGVRCSWPDVSTA